MTTARLPECADAKLNAHAEAPTLQSELPTFSGELRARPDSGQVAATDAHGRSGFSLIHLLKTVGLAIALTLLFMLPQFLIHLPTGIIAPMSAGYTTGGVMKVAPLEAFIIGVTLFLVVCLPAPIAYLTLGFANHLPFIAIAVFSFVAGAYYGTLIGVFSWIGGNWKH